MKEFRKIQSIAFCLHHFILVSLFFNRSSRITWCRGSRPEVFCKTDVMFLKFSQNSQEITCDRASFLIKLQASVLFYRTPPVAISDGDVNTIIKRTWRIFLIYAQKSNDSDSTTAVALIILKFAKQVYKISKAILIIRLEKLFINRRPRTYFISS